MSLFVIKVLFKVIFVNPKQEPTELPVTGSCFTRHAVMQTWQRPTGHQGHYSQIPENEVLMDQ